MTTEKQLRIMVSLLGDRSVKVRNRVSTFLESSLPDSRETLERLKDEYQDPLIRERLELLLSLSQSNDPLEHWRIMSELNSYRLRDGLIALAFIDSEERPSRLELLQKLDELSDAWLNQIPPKAEAPEMVENLMAFLYGKMNFSGNEKNYYSFDNCFLHRMLEHKLGIPVTLSTLSVLLAEEADLPLYGISLPLHFVVGHFQGKRGIQFYDCFDSGREVTKDECVQFLQARGIFFHPQLLSPCGNESILKRVLENIRHIAERNNKNKEFAITEQLIDYDRIHAS